jgi:hypothetical protein
LPLLRCLGNGRLANAAAARGFYDKAIARLHVDLVRVLQFNGRSGTAAIDPEVPVLEACTYAKILENAAFPCDEAPRS